MKKIIPFNNILKFSTDVKEITAISLEHKINKSSDVISGVFYVSGEYKITDGQVEKEKFNFELPFDIALTNNYILDSLVVDIDDFRYSLVSDKELKVNIDLYIDGEEIEKEDIRVYDEEILKEDYSDGDLIDNEDIIKEDTIDEVELEVDNDKDDFNDEVERDDLLKEMLDSEKDENLKVDNNINVLNESNNSNNKDVFIQISDEDEYVTYRVYKVLETDTIDSILEKYNITKEMLADYNSIENINAGDKLIIPTNEK